uniref:Cystinosin homolog n=1 Tax=Rhabditophanes sp. KR3021 TaxID=114890 RepID=A0AC35U4E6_9BILA
MTISVNKVFVICLIYQSISNVASRPDGTNEILSFPSDTIQIIQTESSQVSFTAKKEITENVVVSFNYSDSFLQVEPNSITLTPSKSDATITITGLEVQSLLYVDIAMCSFNGTDPCTPQPTDSFLRVKVIHSNFLNYLVTITGWIYFIAWSISFYPQIYLNFKRKSVVGLNFDFLLLNIIGFSCYTIYNVLLYSDHYVQDLYLKVHQRALIPVLLNDVVFAVHALFACFITVIQCCLYTRENQKVSYTCYGLSSTLIIVALVSYALSLFQTINLLQFINILSFLKMAVTLSKYFPQVLLNYRRQSTIGWSIGNVVLDFTGGFMDIVQMILQALNTNDWTGFYGNPVKFGLGLVSMVFDVVFIIQHYCLYHHANEPQGVEYEGIDTVPNNESLTDNSQQDATENV